MTLGFSGVLWVFSWGGGGSCVGGSGLFVGDVGPVGLLGRCPMFGRLNGRIRIAHPCVLAKDV